MLPPEMLYIKAGRKLKSSSTSILNYTSSQNGGNNSTEKAKEKKTSESIRHQSTSRPIYIRWDNGFRKVIDGGVPNLKIEIPELSELYLGQLIYFFEKACGISGYILGVNPFNQPGVEAYKRNMFALLNKPGYEEESKAIQARI